MLIVTLSVFESPCPPPKIVFTVAPSLIVIEILLYDLLSPSPPANIVNPSADATFSLNVYSVSPTVTMSPSPSSGATVTSSPLANNTFLYDSSSSFADIMFDTVSRAPSFASAVNPQTPKAMTTPMSPAVNFLNLFI